MQPFDHAWNLLKSYTSEPPLPPEIEAVFPRAHVVSPASVAATGGVTRMARPVPPAENHAALSNLSDEELEQWAASGERQHREEKDREFWDDLERRIAAGEVTPTDTFDEGGNAAAGEGYMSGGRQY